VHMNSVFKEENTIFKSKGAELNEFYERKT
jgi:hypothetical protein